MFAQHFCNRLGPAYLHLRNALDESNPAHAEVLNDIKMRFREETFTRESIQQVIHAHPDLVCPLKISQIAEAHARPPAIDSYALRELRYGSLPECRRCISADVSCFCLRFQGETNVFMSPLRPTLSYQRLKTVQPLSDVELYDKIRRTVSNKHELQVFESFLVFNKYALLSYEVFYGPNLTNLSLRHVLKTNFYQPTKVALSFRLVPDFLPESEYPKKPFGMFFIIG